jgi:hypothetical protein
VSDEELACIKAEREAAHYAQLLFKLLFECAPNKIARDYWFEWSWAAFEAAYERGEAIIAHYRSQAE